MAHIAGTLFEPDGHGWVATALSRGPWNPRHCHGSPVAALLARAVEQIDLHDSEPDVVNWQIARLTIDLVRPVPVLSPLTVATRVERPGRKVSIVSAVLAHDDVTVATASALRIRLADIPLPPGSDAPAADVPLPSAGHADNPQWDPFADTTAFHKDGCELRFVEGSWAERGPVTVWVRLDAAVVPDESPSGVQRTAAACDIGNGMSGALPFPEYSFINPDITVHLLRPPTGEWIGVRSSSHYGPSGAGVIEGALFDVGSEDVDGEPRDVVRRLGHSSESVILQRP